MRNRKKHENKFLRTFSSSNIDELFKDTEEKDELWCTREGAKEVINDLNDKEFTVVTDVLGHLYQMKNRSYSLRRNKALARSVSKFLTGKRISKVEWWQSLEDVAPSIKFDDGTCLEIFPMVHIPGAILYHCGEVKQQRTPKTQKKTPKSRS